MLGDSSKPNNSSNKDWVKLNRKTIGKIWQLVDYNVYECVTHETNAYKVWNTLQESREKNNAQNKAFLFLIIIIINKNKKTLFFQKYHDKPSTFEHLNVFQGILNQLDTMEINLGDEIYALCLIGLLSYGCETLFVCFIYLWQTRTHKKF